MERFFERHQSRIVGVLSGFDRVLFRGTLRSICHLTGMDMFLSSQKVLYKDFGTYVNQLSEQLKDHAAAASLGWKVRDVSALELDRTGIGLLETGDHAQGRRLAAPARAEQGEELAFGDRKADVLHRGDLAEAHPDLLQRDRHASVERHGRV